MLGQEEEQLEKLQKVLENMKVRYEDQHNPGTDLGSAWVPSITARFALSPVPCCRGQKTSRQRVLWNL